MRSFISVRQVQDRVSYACVVIFPDGHMMVSENQTTYSDAEKLEQLMLKEAENFK